MTICRRVLLAICLLAGLAASNAVHAQSAANTFTVILDVPASDLDPASSYDAESDIIGRGCYEGLVTLNGASLTDVVPLLAESWDNQKDTVYTFKLRHGVKFHDGTDFNADAAKFGLSRNITARLGIENILGTFIPNPARMIVVVDPYTLRITLDQPQPLFLIALAASYGTTIVSPKAVRDHAVLDKDGKSDNAHSWLETHEDGTGPYTLGGAEMKPDMSITLRRFGAYWRSWTGDHLDQVVLKTISESRLRRVALERNEGDAALDLLPEDLDKLDQSGHFQFDTNPSLRVDMVILGDYGPLKDPRARQAIAYAFDYAAYDRGALGNRGQQAHGPFPSTLLGYEPATFTYPTDLKKARQLLDEAGIKPGTQLVFMTNAGTGELAGAILKQQLEQIGLKVQIKHDLDYASFIDIFTGPLTDDRANFFFEEWWPDYDSPLNWSYPLFYSKSAGSGGYNGGYYANAQVDKAIENAQKATTIPELTSLFQGVQQIVTRDDPAAVFLAQAPVMTAVSKAIKGHIFNALYLDTFDLYALSRGTGSSTN